MLCTLGAPAVRLNEDCIGEGKSLTEFSLAWPGLVFFRFVRMDATNLPLKEWKKVVDAIVRKDDETCEGRGCPQSFKTIGDAIMKNNKSINKILLALCLFVFQAVAFAEDYHVNVLQLVAMPGGEYGDDVTSASIPYSNISNGKLNLRYHFSLETDDEKSDNQFISCVIKIPETNFNVIAFDGVQTFKSEDEQISAIFQGYDYTEFLIPVKDTWKGVIEIQMTISSDQVDSDLPVEMYFNGYKRKMTSYFPLTSKSV